MTDTVFHTKSKFELAYIECLSSWSVCHKKNYLCSVKIRFISSYRQKYIFCLENQPVSFSTDKQRRNDTAGRRPHTHTHTHTHKKKKKEEEEEERKKERKQRSLRQVSPVWLLGWKRGRCGPSKATTPPFFGGTQHPLLDHGKKWNFGCKLARIWLEILVVVLISLKITWSWGCGQTVYGFHEHRATYRVNFTSIADVSSAREGGLCCTSAHTSRLTSWLQSSRWHKEIYGGPLWMRLDQNVELPPRAFKFGPVPAWCSDSLLQARCERTSTQSYKLTFNAKGRSFSSSPSLAQPYVFTMALVDLLAGLDWQAAAFRLPLLLVAYLVVKVCYRQIFPDRRPGEPPVIRSALPWIGSLFPFLKDPNAFVDANRQKLGNVFSAIVAGRRMVFVCDHRCLPEVFRRTHDLSFDAIKLQTVIPAFGRGDFLNVLDAYPDVDDDLAKRLSGPNLGHVSARFHDTLRSHLGLLPLPGSNKMFYEIAPGFSDLNCKTWPDQGKTWHSLNLVSLLMLMTSINCDVFLGPGTSDPQFREDLFNFSKSFGILSKGLPEWFPLPSLQAALKARERLYTSSCVVNYTEKTSPELLSRREIFIERMGSGKYKTFADVGFLFANVVNTNQTTFWVLANLIHQPEAEAAIKTELDEVLGKDGSFSTDPAELRDQLHRLVKLDSAINEVLRFHSTGFTSRIAAENLCLSVGDEKFNVRKNDFFLVNSPCIHMNPDIFGDDVGVYRWDRFLTDDKTRPRRFTDAKTGQAVPHPLVAFGGGVSLCPGRHFARDEMRLTAATILRAFDIQLDSPDQGFPKVDSLAAVSVAMPLKGEKYLVRMKLRGR